MSSHVQANAVPASSSTTSSRTHRASPAVESVSKMAGSVLPAYEPGTDGSAEPPSILLIIPYFGKLPGYLNLFFRSCRENPSVNWLLITDQQIDENTLPYNVSVKKTSFAATKKAIDRIMGFETALLNPYKLCDFRPAYGVIFSEEVASFQFWGYCDTDVIFGNIRKFITNDILRRYDKVLAHGHLSLYRNCDEANHYFRLTAPGVSFRDVFTSPKSTQFDESGGIELILNHHKIPYFRNDGWLADIDLHHYDLRTVHFPNYRHQYFYWEKGRIFRGFHDGKTIGKQEYLYIHLQKRPMKQMFSGPGDQLDAWYITPRSFIAKTSEPQTPAEMDQLNQRNLIFDCKQYASSSLWHVKRAVIRKIAQIGHRASV